MYVDGGLNWTSWEAQCLEHRLISEAPPGVGFSLKVVFEQDHLVAQGGS